MRLLLTVLVLMTGGVITATAMPLPRSILFITQSSPSSGGTTAVFAALASDPNVNSNSRIPVYTEHLDLNRFPSPQYLQLARNYFRDKYRETPIGVVVVDGPIGLDFVLSWRSEIWPEIPVVFYNLDEGSTAQLNLPPNVTGFIAHQTFGGMLDAAQMLVPGLKRVALVGDPPERDAYRRNYRQEIAALATDVEFIDLTGLAVTEVKERVAVLPNDTVVFYTAVFIDGAAVVYTPQSALLAISGVTSRPIFTDVESQLGYGAVGGFVYSLTSAAHEAVRLAARILDGENASQIPIVKIDLNKPIFDARELKRWNISEDRLPPGSEVRFRELSIWEQYRWQMTGGLSVVLLQAAMISWLLLERRRRHVAEVETADRRRQVVHLNRTATTAVLSGAIAHELNQPLGAILSNAEAAEMLLKTDPPDLKLIGDILSDIRRDDQRAGEIIHHLRNFLKNRNVVELQELDLNDIVAEVVRIVKPEAAKRSVQMGVVSTSRALLVRADKVQLHQVMLNLVMNGMDALENCNSQTRKLTIQTSRNGDFTAEVTVLDSGDGISINNLTSIFEPFFTSKPQGTGLGLPIARTIIESYGGTLSAENRFGGGAAFSFTLPVA